MRLIDELEKLDREATPGPWEVDKSWSTTAISFAGWSKLGYMGFNVADEADAELIAKTRNALPKLVAVVRASEELACCREPIMRENWTPQNCGSCSECQLMKALAALEEP